MIEALDQNHDPGERVWQAGLYVMELCREVPVRCRSPCRVVIGAVVIPLLSSSFTLL
jgi:hypothetical protein